ncbi:MmyB family transcriptional regulator [Spongiactinospora gelatinilytica]|uniref:MmyB family transcriptional regulator n=1 Tax=Spongiactinospora gelatinilytica TaxID=2666298 RepID=UPI001F356F71|nr:hypothetical protein [Spongiactinospora gelatinilytica]
MRQVVRGHEPYPAVAMGRRWNMLFANSAIDVFLEGVDPALLRPRVNMMRVGLHPSGYAPRLLNLAQVRAFLLPRLARQAARTGDPELTALYEDVRSYGPDDDPPPLDPADIALPIRIRHQGTELTFISTVTTFGTAFDITLDDIAVEAFFPGDATTIHHFGRVPGRRAGELTN